MVQVLDTYMHRPYYPAQCEALEAGGLEKCRPEEFLHLPRDTTKSGRSGSKLKILTYFKFRWLGAMRVKGQNFPDSSQKGWDKIPLSTLESWMSSSTLGRTSVAKACSIGIFYLLNALDIPSTYMFSWSFLPNRLDSEEGRRTGGHKQMVQLDKRVKTSFQWWLWLK